ncbi:hypothetical protein [Clostridium sp.]|uniref:hypothetical protein n=1 Tax=Clostridium sp. TaxID=1506 RepID=UPI00262846E6|nr:hypothetical protein [Clostridium sp.]
MYKRIESQLVLIGKSKKELADELGIRYNTLLLKFKGSSSFTLDEALAIKQILKTQYTVEELFKKGA